MFKWVFVPLFLLPSLLSAQHQLQVGINVPALVMNTLDFRVGWKLTPSFILEGATGFRQQEVPAGATPRVAVLHDFIQQHNQGGFLSVGGRFVNTADNRYEFPFIAFDLTGIYFRDEIMRPTTNGTEPSPETFSGFRWGGSMTIGFSIRLKNRLYLDLGMQMGYSPPREIPLQYFYGGMGFSTYRPSAFGVKGGHIQPLVCLKYTLIQDRRDRLRDME
jgi:hypothetical protein